MSAGCLEFRILGPLTVLLDGEPVPVGGRKQRVLLALLLLDANRVVSRERLVEELFPDQTVHGADHALRNQVSRLRKALDHRAGAEPRLVARAPGYLLRVEQGEVDLEHFAQLAARGRDALAAGNPAAAAEALRTAEQLWRGRPLADLEFEPFALAEVERLEELRLLVLEERIDAELAIGRHHVLVSELEGLCVEHPYRERLRAQLMLAFYRAGRQAEGLDVYRRTRTLLSEELGLEPGVALRELEHAILMQDPVLDPPAGVTTRPASPPLVDVCPFKGLAPFEADDAELYFGRERLVTELVARMEETSLLVVSGPSGSGKSSLLRAGVLPALGGESLVVRPGDRAVAELAAVVGRVAPDRRLVLAVDQFEDVFAVTVSEDERQAFIHLLVEAAWDPERRTTVVVAMRADFAGDIARYGPLADLVAANQMLLGPMSATELRRAIEGPAARVGLRVEPELVDALVDDVGGEAGALPLLSTAMVDVWREREDGRLTLAAYRRTGGVRGAVGRHAEAAYHSLEDADRTRARVILLRLVAGGDGVPLTRRRVGRAELDADDPRVARVLDVLVERRLVVATDGTYELVHDSLLERWSRLVGWVDEDVQGRRLQRHLAEAASAWDASGRDPSELFRGARLAATLDWVENAVPDAGLNRIERDFLAESRTAFTRANRRLRVLLALAVVLLAAAVAAGAVALSAQRSAERQATAAIAQQLGAQALVEPGLDHALLLAREGVRLDNTVSTRRNLLAVLMRAPAAVAVRHGAGSRVLDDALSHDGRTLAVRSADGTVSFFDTRSLREVGPRYHAVGQIQFADSIVRPIRAMAFSADDSRLVIGDGGEYASVDFVDARTHTRESLVFSTTTVATADVAFSPDGRTIVTGEIVPADSSPPSLVLMRRRADDGEVLRESTPIPGGRLVGFTRDGRSLLVTSGESRSLLLDSRTFAVLRSFPVSGTAALSPTRDVAALGRADGGVRLLDLRTGTARPMSGLASDRVVALAFSRDGKVLASASDDGTVAVWDVPAAALRETFTGHAGAALGTVFSRGGETLFSASRDGSVIVWDVRGTKRLGRPFRFAPTARPGTGPQRALDSASTAVAVSPGSGRFATSPGPGRVTIWRADRLAAVGELRGPVGSIASIAWSHDGRLIAASGTRSTVVWDVGKREIVRTLHADLRDNTWVGFSPDDSLLATVSSGGWLRLVNVGTGKSSGGALLCGYLVTADFSPDGRRIAVGGYPRDIVIWDVRRREVECWTRHRDAVLAIRFSPDGRELITGDSRGNVAFWDPATGHRKRTLRTHDEEVVGVSYGDSSTQFLTTSGDGELGLWELESGELRGAPLSGGDAEGAGALFPNGRRAVAVFRSGKGIVWNLDRSAWATHACRVAHRRLTESEWRTLLPQRTYRPAC
jgi:WD40 repeat protein/DNA-binding SARP family transcriptional activator